MRLEGMNKLKDQKGLEKQKCVMRKNGFYRNETVSEEKKIQCGGQRESFQNSSFSEGQFQAMQGSEMCSYK
jgi:hypothetical protein